MKIEAYKITTKKIFSATSLPIIIFLFSVFYFLPSNASPPANPSGLPLPRFVSLKAEEVNARTGPGVNYPIKWVYNRKFLPVEIVEEFGNWRKIRDNEGEEGWVLQSLISGNRSAITKTETFVYNTYKGDLMVLRLARGVQVNLEKCKEIQCQIEYNKTSGWVDREKIWGIYEKEVFD